VGFGVAGAIVLVGVVILGYSARSNFGSSSAARHNAERIYICSETGNTFNYSPEPGTKLFPVRSPYSGKDTGYPAQFCYWTPGGKIKKEPTYVLMNSYKGVKGPTFCPDCNRMVAADNPVVTEGAAPPPTKDEYLTRRKARSRHGETDTGDD
jgi:hypothetical protein